MEVQSPALTFPVVFCCNCGAGDCRAEIQDTRTWRYFGIGRSGTIFHLALPICAGCRRTIRRRPAGLFGKLLVLGGTVVTLFLGMLLLAANVQLPVWIGLHVFAISMTIGIILTILFYYLRRARPPRTSFYQPVRIRKADVRISAVMNGPGQVTFMKLAFTNADYLNAFADANREAIKSGHLAAVRA
jgi:hypothetical protein